MNKTHSKKSLLFVLAVACVLSNQLPAEDAVSNEGSCIRNALQKRVDADIRYRQRIDAVRKQKGTFVKPCEKTLSERCAQNAMLLAIRFPNSELSHAVYANILQEEMSQKEIDECYHNAKEAKDKNLEQEWKQYIEQIDKLEKVQEATAVRIWQHDILSVVSKVLLAGSECKIYVPSSVEKDTKGVHGEGYVLYDDRKGFFECAGLEICAPTNTCIINMQRERWLNCEMPREFLGRKFCDVHCNAAGCIDGIHFLFSPRTKAEYDTTLETVANAVRAMVEYKNRSFLVSDDSAIDRKGAIFALNIFKDHRSYIVRIDQSHRIVENQVCHFVALRIMFGNDIKAEWEPPKDGIHLGKLEACEEQSVKKSITIAGQSKELGAKIERENDEQLHQDIKRKAKSWGRKYYQERSLSQYKSATQRLRRRQIAEVSELLSEMAVAYKGKGRDEVFKECAAIINRYYKIDRADYWSSCYGNSSPDLLTMDVFAKEIGSILDSLQGVIKDFGVVDDCAKRRDKLMLQIQCGVNSWEELKAKIAAQRAMEAAAERERQFQQEERRIQAVEDAADAIRHQTMDVYHHW